ncbi:potassium-transporting ATPase subunit F [Leptospira johnsonii]|uniref:potassium-transporting ATPase subunit F n=1 Tax=Leptospira johnsonii TaxID=1917820 RepID=UPI00350E40E5
MTNSKKPVRFLGIDGKISAWEEFLSYTFLIVLVIALCGYLSFSILKPEKF